MLVALQPGHVAARDLSAAAFVLARPHATRRRLFGALALLGAQALCVAGAGALGYAVGVGYEPSIWKAPATLPISLAAPPPKSESLRPELEQAQLALRLAEARAQELERQVDALNEKLRESNEQLAFLRTAREGKRKGER